MVRNHLLALALIVVCVAAARADEQVNVAGTAFATSIEQRVGNRTVKQVLTGAGMRKKLVFNVYAIGSYVDAGAKVRSAEELASANAVKQLHLVMHREVSGPEMADAVAAAIRMNYPVPAFDAETKALTDKLRGMPAIRTGHVIRLTHLPGSGFHAQLSDDSQVLIKNPNFSRAVWDIFLGRNNLGEALKTALVARIK